MAILENISVSLSLDKVRRRLHMKPDSDMNQVRTLVDTVQQLIEPRAIYKVCYIEAKSEDSVIVGGLRLSSQVLRKNLDRVERIFPYAITLGSKLGEKQNACSDILENYYLDCIGNLALTSVQKQLKKHLQSKFALEKMSSMAPGSLSDWPIEEQGPLFKLLGDVEASIGVRLTRKPLDDSGQIYLRFLFPDGSVLLQLPTVPQKKVRIEKSKIR